MHSFHTKETARNLRVQGKTYTEISSALSISKSTVSLWCRDIILTDSQKKLITNRRIPRKMTREERMQIRDRLEPFRTKHSKETLLQKITSFYETHERIPLKRELNAWREYQKRFGSWNAAIEAAGFTPNPSLFSNKFKARDGHSCDSFSEKIIDDWLFKHSIDHKRNVSYGDTRYTADFLIRDNIFIEFFGLAGVQSVYDSRIERKRRLAKNLGYTLIEIYPEDIYEKEHLEHILKAL